MQRARSSRTPLLLIQLVTFTLTAFAATPALTQTVIEKRLAELRPCSNLKTTTKVLGQPVAIGIDKLQGVALSRAEVAVIGDDVSLSFVGGLSCRASDNATIKGDASVDLTASAEMHLADCSVRSLSITPTGFGGSLGEVVKSAWTPLIHPKLEAEARAMLIDACTDFVAGQ